MPRVSRPVFLKLSQIHLPLSGWVSILHRVSGALLFLALPLGVWALSRSLEDEVGFQCFADAMAHPLARLALLGMTWAFAHHFFAGLRHLALDADWGTDLRRARQSSIAVVLASGLITLLVALKLFA